MWLVATILDGAVIDYSIPAEISLGHHRSTVIRRSLPSLTLQLRYPFHKEVFPTPTPCLNELLDCPLQYPTIWELPGCWCELPGQPRAQWGQGLIRVLLFSHSVMSSFWYPMDCSMPGFPVLHYLPKFAQIHVHWVSDAIQPSHPVTPFSSCCQSFPASESFLMSLLFTSESWWKQKWKYPAMPQNIAS